MGTIDNEYVNNSETRFRILEEMKSLKTDLEKNGYAEYAKMMSQMIAKFGVKYGTDLII